MPRRGVEVGVGAIEALKAAAKAAQPGGKGSAALGVWQCRGAF